MCWRTSVQHQRTILVASACILLGRNAQTHWIPRLRGVLLCCRDFQALSFGDVHMPSIHIIHLVSMIPETGYGAKLCQSFTRWMTYTKHGLSESLHWSARFALSNTNQHMKRVRLALPQCVQSLLVKALTHRLVVLRSVSCLIAGDHQQNASLTLRNAGWYTLYSSQRNLFIAVATILKSKIPCSTAGQTNAATSRLRH